MTSFNTSYSNTYEPPMSDLLKEHLAKPQAGGLYAQNPAGKAVNTVPAANNLNAQTSDSYEGTKKQGKKAKVAAVSLSTALLVTLISILGATKTGRGLVGKANKAIFSSAEGIVRKLYDKFGGEGSKLEGAVKKMYRFGEEAGQYFNVPENIINGKDVLTDEIAHIGAGNTVNVEKLGPVKEKLFKLYKNTIGRIFAVYEPFSARTSALYNRCLTDTGAGNYLKAGGHLKTAEEQILEALNGAGIQNAAAAKRAKIKLSRIMESYDSNFSSDAVRGRFGDIQASFQRNERLSGETKKRFIEMVKAKDFKGFLTKPVARGIIKDEKTLHAAKVGNMAAGITNNLFTSLDKNADVLQDAKKIIGADDIQSLYKFEETLNLFNRYKKQVYTGSLEASKTREIIVKQLDDLTETLGKYSQKSGSDKARQAISRVGEVKQSILSTKNSDMEDLIDSLKDAVDEETFNRLLKGLKKSQKSFRKAYKMEMGDAIDKFRDISCGSAPTDFLTAITSTALLGVYTAQAENNDERVTLGLKTGLPIISAVGANLYGAMTAKSGSVSLAMTTAVGAVTKVICDKLNDLYRNIRGLDKEEKVSVKTIDDYVEPYKNKFENIFFEPAE